MATSIHQTWGLCMHCQWWQIEPKAKLNESTIGSCIDDTLQPYRLSIPGNGGCSRYMKGQPARAEGSSRQPPAAMPTR